MLEGPVAERRALQVGYAFVLAARRNPDGLGRRACGCVREENAKDHYRHSRSCQKTLGSGVSANKKIWKSQHRYPERSARGLEIEAGKPGMVSRMELWMQSLNLDWDSYPVKAVEAGKDVPDIKRWFYMEHNQKVLLNPTEARKPDMSLCIMVPKGSLMVYDDNEVQYPEALSE